MELIKHKNKYYIKSDGGYREVIASSNPDLIKEDIASIDDEFIKEYVKNPVEFVNVEYNEIHPVMYSDGIDSRGDYIYYCPKCHHGGSYMGIIHEKDIPHCYKEECRDIELELSSNGSILIKPSEKDENTWFNEYQKVEDHIISLLGDKFTTMTLIDGYDSDRTIQMIDELVKPVEETWDDILKEYEDSYESKIATLYWYLKENYEVPTKKK